MGDKGKYQMKTLRLIVEFEVTGISDQSIEEQAHYFLKNYYPTYPSLIEGFIASSHKKYEVLEKT